MPFLELADVRIFFTDSGIRQAPPVVLLHGWACDSHDWSWQLPAFEQWARVVALDLRGHGRSSRAGTGYDLLNYVGDIRRAVDQLELKSSVLVGHSFGAVVATMLAQSAPELVRALIVVDPAYGYGPEVAAAAPAMIDALRTSHAESAIAALITEPDSPRTDPAFTMWRKRRAIGMEPEVLLETMSGHLNDASGVAFRPQADDILRERNVPVLAFYRDEEKAMWEASLSTHPSSRQQVTPRLGHWLHQEDPETFNSLVREWTLAQP